jgi:hypothetical protein
MVYLFQRQLGIRLAAWSIISIVTGIVLVAAGSGFLDGFGLQALIWGTIDGVIAAIGMIAGVRWSRAPHDIEQAERALRRLYHILRINTFADTLYVVAGILVAVIWGNRGAFILGTGWGIIIQGTFLFAYDLVHIILFRRRLPDDPQDVR